MSSRVLYISHNHPSVRPGGSEGYALALHRAMRSAPGWESVLIAHGGPPLTHVTRYHETMLALVDRAPDEYYFHSDLAGFDPFFGWNDRKELWTHFLRDFLQTYKPDVVHFQHTLFLGYDMIREVRNTLPDATILYTLHEYVPICHQSGQMVRVVNDHELCTHSSPRRCHECFPEHSPQSFFMRKRFIQAMFELVDLFIAPSTFLRQRYIDWGLEPERIRIQENGCALSPPARTENPSEDRPRNRLGFFGQLNRFKGIDVLLEAMRILNRDGVRAHLYIHGANLDLQVDEFQNRVRDLLSTCTDNVTLVGRYEQSVLPELMANVDWVVVPSIWWENSPLVIQEAFLYGRPVICSDIGGMAEKVTNGVNGLHFRVRDPHSLAAALRRATTRPNLWRVLREGIPPVHRMQDHVTVMSKLYLDLIAQKGSATRATVVEL